MDIGAPGPHREFHMQRQRDEEANRISGSSPSDRAYGDGKNKNAGKKNFITKSLKETRVPCVYPLTMLLYFLLARTAGTHEAIKLLANYLDQ